MSKERKIGRFESLEQKIKQLEEELKEAKLKTVTQLIANQHIIQGNNINDSSFNANVSQYGNSLKFIPIKDDIEKILGANKKIASLICENPWLQFPNQDDAEHYFGKWLNVKVK